MGIPTLGTQLLTIYVYMDHVTNKREGKDHLRQGPYILFSL